MHNPIIRFVCIRVAFLTTEHMSFRVTVAQIEQTKGFCDSTISQNREKNKSVHGEKGDLILCNVIVEEKSFSHVSHDPFF